VVINTIIPDNKPKTKRSNDSYLSPIKELPWVH